MASPPPVLDPPFRGYIETTFDSLLVFEAARRGMIPRVTRRLIDRERGMVQSGAVFVFDEHESGIKRWTDGLVWSPSRILGNFLVYRETDKRPANAPAAMSTAHPPPHPSNSSSPASGSSPSNTPNYASYDANAAPPLGAGQLRPRSTSEGGTVFDRQKERQLVGSLTSSYKFKEGGLVKKTMSVTVNGFSQHMISYYSVEDVLAGKLRSPSTIPELASLEISPEYLSKQNFRFPPQIEIGHDGIPRYRGEPEEPGSPSSQSHHSLPMMQYGHPQDMAMYEPYGQPMHPQSSPAVRSRSVTGPILIPLSSSHGSSYMGPGTPQSGSYMEAHPGPPPPIMRQNSSSSIQSAASSSGAIRPTSSHRRYDPYGEGHPSGSPRSATSIQHQYRRQSIQPVMQPGSHSSSDMYAPSPYQAPGALPALAGSYQGYQYQPPATAPSTYNEYYAPLPRSANSQSQGLPSPLSPNAVMPSAFPAQQQQYWPRGSGPSDQGIMSRQQEFGGPPSSSGSSGGSGAVSMSSGPQRPMSGPHPAAVVSPIPNGDAAQMPPQWPPQPWNGSVDSTGMAVRPQGEEFGSPQQQSWPRPSQETRIS